MHLRVVCRVDRWRLRSILILGIQGLRRSRKEGEGQGALEVNLGLLLGNSVESELAHLVLGEERFFGWWCLGCEVTVRCLRSSQK